MAKLDFGPHRTSLDYRFTTMHLDSPDVEALKSQAESNNKQVREVSREHGRVIGKLQRVRQMGRGPRISAARKDGYTYDGAYYTYLPHRHADHWDVYLSEDTSGQDLLRQEIATGMTPGEIAKVAKLKTAIWKLEMKGHLRVHNR